MADTITTNGKQGTIQAQAPALEQQKAPPSLAGYIRKMGKQARLKGPPIHHHSGALHAPCTIGAKQQPKAGYMHACQLPRGDDVGCPAGA
ncbi:MAG: hypothetical protein FWG30_01085 [Eubacteriaceae bacterium]|nr:hypothetical protein [Eubacteriaceae bacterium]